MAGKLKSKGSPFKAANLIDGVGFTIGAEATNAINVALQFRGANGRAIAERGSVLAYLSDDVNGDSVTATAPSSGVAIGTDGLAIETIADKSFLLVSESNGKLDVTLTEATAKTWYLVCVLPDGRLAVSGAIAFV